MNVGIIAVYFYIFKLGREGRVAAMVRPIRVDNLYFRFRGVALFLSEIVADESQVFYGHCKPDFCVVCRNFAIRIIYKARHFLYVFRGDRDVGERKRLFKPYFFAFDGVYEVFFNLFELLFVHARNCVNGCALDERAFLLR